MEDKIIADNQAELQELMRQADSVCIEARKLDRQIAEHDAKVPPGGPGRAQRRAVERWVKKAAEYKARFEKLEAEGQRITTRMKELIGEEVD